jgi:predicted nuclease of predicted toxin-antitoxin system
MNLLADENIDRQIVDRLRKDGHSVEYIAEMDPGISDDEILRIAHDRNALLLTGDKDFGELLFRLRRISTGVMLLRLAGKNAEEKSSIVAQIIKEHSDSLLGSFSVLSRDQFRIRVFRNSAS